jgi:UDP:flavonoid glycosyltransferase YjiC (YdhE family)
MDNGMATVLFAWELGEGLGHLMRMLPLAEGLVRRGYRVYLASHDLAAAGAMFGRAGIHFLQAPAKRKGRRRFPRTLSFAHLLGNVTFADDGEALALTSAWRNLFRLTKPDLIVFDHSPAALVAARGLAARRMVIGTGFCCPPDVYPLPILLPHATADIGPSQIATDEDEVLCRVNRLLEHWSQPPLGRLGQLYGDVDACFLTTLAELDHFTGRIGGRYCGPINASGGKPPEWPAGGQGKPVFAYLKPSHSLEYVLESLNARGNPTLIYPDGIDAKTRRRFESQSLHFQVDRPDPRQAARECDLAILNAGHGTTCDVLLAGRPVLQLPLQTEQLLEAEAVARLGAGRTLEPARRSRRDADEAIDDLLTNESYARTAQAFADRYASFDAQEVRSNIIETACELASSGSARKDLAPLMTTGVVSAASWTGGTGL